MGFQRDEASMALPSCITQHSSWFDIRLFYVRVSPCVADSLPDFIALVLPRREIGVALEINGSRFPTSESVRLSMRRDRVDNEASEVTYVSTDSVRVTGSVEFEGEPEANNYRLPNGNREYMHYAEGMCTGEGGQLSWFNAGVRVGVGIALGVSIGAGLLMRSYQKTTWKFMRKLL